MSNRRRAIVIGLLGPGIAGFGFVWALLRSLAESPDSATFRYLVFDSPHMLMAVGILVSIVTLPIVIDVALAAPEEVDIPVFEAEGPEMGEAPGVATQGAYNPMVERSGGRPA